MLGALAAGSAGAAGDPTLTLAFTGTGAGTVTSPVDPNLNCSSSAPSAAGCSDVVAASTFLELQANPADGSYFAGWSGDCSGAGYVYELTMPDADATCTAEFDDGGGTQGGATLTVTTGADDAGNPGTPGNSSPTCYVAYCTFRDALVNGSGKTIAFAGGVTTVQTGSGFSLTDPAQPVVIDGGTGVTIDGGGVAVTLLAQTGGTLTLSHVTLTHSAGGGIVQQGGTLTLQDVTVSNSSRNEGGGIFSTGTLNLVDSTIQGNHASQLCGGVEMTSGSVTNTDFSSNTAALAGGGLCIDGTATLNGGTVENNSAPVSAGVGIKGTLTGGGTVITGNTSSNAGSALYAGMGGSATLVNETIFGNHQSAAVETDFSASSIKLVNATIAGNDRGVNGAVTLLNTILAGQHVQNCGTPPTSLGHNIDDVGGCSLSGTGDQSVDPLLDDPSVDGHIALLAGSPALDTGAKGTVGGLTVPAVDALGTARPQGGGVDVGATEMAEHKLTVKTAGPGHGTVTPDVAPAPGGWYLAGTTVNLTAAPDTGSGFSGWSGSCTGSANPKAVVLSADATCTATFVLAPAIKTFAPAKGRIRSTVTLTGKGFTGTTSVTFGGHPAASFKVTGDTKIAAVVPDDAETGPIAVTNGAGDAQTAGDWTLVWVVPRPAALKPAKAGAGFTVTITGTGFLGASAVTFNGVPADSFAVVSDTKLTAVVPNNAGTTGPVAVTTPGGTGQTKAPFTFVPKPAVTSFDPTSGPFGTPVTITGSHFTGALEVTFGLTPAKFKVVNDTTITTTVPVGAVTDPVTVSTMGGTGISASDFTVTYLTPAVTSFSPVKGKVGVKVTIVGKHFVGSTSVTFGGHAASFTIVSDTKITATVPAGAASGPIAVTNPAGTGTSTKPFFVAT